MDLHYIEEGSGYPLVLLHGNGESLEYFTHQIDFFSRNYRVIAVDTRGHGLSPRGCAPFTIEQFAEDLNNFFVELEIKKAFLLGFSDGANIAMVFTLKYPGKVRGLILNGGNLFPEGLKNWVRFQIDISYYWAKFKSLLCKKAEAEVEILWLMKDQPHINPNDLASITCPVIVIAGSNDMIKDEHTRLIVSSIKNSIPATITGDHFVANKKLDIFNRQVNYFLGLFR